MKDKPFQIRISASVVPGGRGPGARLPVVRVTAATPVMVEPPVRPGAARTSSVSVPRVILGSSVRHVSITISHYHIYEGVVQ